VAVVTGVKSGGVRNGRVFISSFHLATTGANVASTTSTTHYHHQHLRRMEGFDLPMSFGKKPKPSNRAQVNKNMQSKVAQTKREQVSCCRPSTTHNHFGSR